MANYLVRTCPKCGDYFGVVLPRLSWKSKETPVNGLCAFCGYKFSWKLVDGKSTTLARIAVALAAVFLFTSSFAYHFRIVHRVVEGDTLVLENGERVRLIGVDTPESVDPRRPVEYFGKEAAEFTKKMVEGRRVRLEFDPANAHTGHKDNTRQGRTLAYVYLEDGILL